MKLQVMIVALLFSFSIPIMADTLYQANVGGYPTNSGPGLGFSIGPTGAPYTAFTGNYYGYYGGSYYGSGAGPYPDFNCPYNSGCAGCNHCN